MCHSLDRKPRDIEVWVSLSTFLRIPSPGCLPFSAAAPIHSCVDSSCGSPLLLFSQTVILSSYVFLSSAMQKASLQSQSLFIYSYFFAHCIQYSQVVFHPSTNQAGSCFASETRDWVHSQCCGCRLFTLQNPSSTPRTSQGWFSCSCRSSSTSYIHRCYLHHNSYRSKI